MRKYIPVIVLLVLLFSFITVVSAEDVNETEVITDNTDNSQESSTNAEIIPEDTVGDDNEETIQIEGDDCSSVIIQGNNNDSTISSRRNSDVETAINIIHNSSIIKQSTENNYTFFHVLISKDGWVVGNGGTDVNNVSAIIEENALEMIKNNEIVTGNFENIVNLKLNATKGHFVIKAPNGTYALFIHNNGTTYNESGVLTPGYALVVPNDPSYFKEGKYQNLSSNSYVITSSRLISAKDTYGDNRRDIITYSYKQNGRTSNVKIYACNDDGRYVNKSTGNFTDSITTNNASYSASNIPSITNWTLIDDVNFTVRKLNTTITSEDINVNSPDIVLNATIKDENDELVNEGFVSFLFDNRTLKDEEGNVIYVNVTNGTVSINHSIPNFWKKTNHTYYVRYYGTSQYEANLGNIASVNESDVIDLSSTHAEVTRFGTNLTITAYVNYKSNDTPIDVGHVLFKVNGKTIRNPDNSTYTIDIENGTAVFNLILDEKYSAKEYKVTVVYGYGAFREESNTTVNIHKVPTNVINTTVNVENNTVKVTGLFVDDNEELIPYNSYFSLKIDGKTVKDSLNNTQTFNITDSLIDCEFDLQYTYKKGDHTLTIVIPELRETLGVRVNATMTIVKQ